MVMGFWGDIISCVYLEVVGELTRLLFVYYIQYSGASYIVLKRCFTTGMQFYHMLCTPAVSCSTETLTSHAQSQREGILLYIVGIYGEISERPPVVKSRRR